MESANETSRPAILEKAWMHHAELDTNADRLSKRHLNLRKWVLILGIFATFLAIVTNLLNARCQEGDACSSIRAIFTVLLILTPLIGSMIAAFTSRELGDGRWLAMRAGAEEIKKEIYIYRTVLQHHPNRNKWLSNRLAYIQRQIFKASGRRLDTVPYKGNVPLYFSPDNPDSDSGFTDLAPEDYIKHRLQEQLSWHEGRIVRLSKARRNLTIAILLAGVAGSLLAALGTTITPLAVWVALTAAITASLTGWEELRNRDKTILNYSKVKLELTIIRDYWYSLSPEEQTDSEFYKMVLAAENVMFAQNGEWLRSMQETLAGVDDEDKKLVEEMVAQSATSHAELQRKLLIESQKVMGQATEQLAAVVGDAAATVSGMVTAVSSEAMALNQAMAESVDAAAAEAAAARLALETSRDAALDEAAAWRETAQESATTAVAQSTAAREAARAATTAEAIAWGQTAQEAATMAAAQSAAARESMAETAEAMAAEADATRLALETSRDEALVESAAWRETAQESAADAIAQAAAVRDDTAAAVAAETTAWSETAQDAVDAAVTQSTAARDAAETAVTAETAAWSEAAQDAVDTAVTQSAAARDAATAEAAAWGEMAQEVVDTAVSEAALLREKAGEQVKYAVTFAPITATIEEFGTAVTEQWANVTYEAVPDIKYPVQFTPPAAENGEPAPPPDPSVDAAVDRLLEAGVQVADDAIKQALAKAAQEENG